MGFFLGIVDYQAMEGVEEFVWDSIHLREELVHDAKMIPDQPLISEADWEQLRSYYIEGARRSDSSKQAGDFRDLTYSR